MIGRAIQEQQLEREYCEELLGPCEDCPPCPEMPPCRKCPKSRTKVKYYHVGPKSTSRLVVDAMRRKGITVVTTYTSVPSDAPGETRCANMSPRTVTEFGRWLQEILKEVESDNSRE